MIEIHPTAIVDKKAELGSEVKIGANSIIGADVIIGNNTVIGHHTIIEGPTRIGDRCKISHYCSLGGPPQDLKYKGELTELIIGDDNVFREFCTVNRGTMEGNKKTVIGSKNLFMAYCHVAHDCLVGNNNIFANCATMAGHVLVEDYITIGGLSAIHQFYRIGCRAFIGGCSAVNDDVPPFCAVWGNRARYHNVNIIGLRRSGFKPGEIRALQEVYEIFYSQIGNTDLALETILQRFPGNEHVKMIVEFIRTTKKRIVPRAMERDGDNL